MKRPPAYIGLSVLASLAAAAVFKTAAVSFAAVCAFISAVLIALRIFSGKRFTTAAAVFLSAAAAFASYALADAFIKAPVENEYDGQRVVFSGVITSDMYTSGKTTMFTVRTDTINGSAKRLNIRVSASTVPDCEPFDRITARAVLGKLSTDDFGLDYGTYYDSRRIFLGTYISPYGKTYYTTEKNETLSFPDRLEKRFCLVRRRISREFEFELPYDEAALCTAMVTGDKTRLPDDIRSRFSVLGISHLIVVSGFHMSVLAGVLALIATALFKNRYLSCAVQLAGVLAFCALTGFGYSTRRALIVFLILILGNISHSKPDPINSIGIAALVICTNPFAAGDIGVLSSFSTSASIVLFAGKLTEMLWRKKKDDERSAPAVIKLLAVECAALIGLLPFSLLVSKQLSPYCLIANLLCVPVSGIVVFCGCAAAALTVFGLPCSLFTLISGAAARYMLFVSERLRALPFARQSTDSIAVTVWFIVSALMIFLVCFAAGKRDRLKLCAAVSLTALAGVVCADTFLHASDAVLTVDDSCGGMTAVLEFEGGSAVLCAFGESGRYGEVKECVSDFDGISCVIDVLPNPKSYSYTRKLLSDLGAGCVITDSGNEYSWYALRGGEVRQIGSGYTLDLGVGLLEIYHTDSGFCEYLKINGKEILICPVGDIPERFKSPDIAVADHTYNADELDGSQLIFGNYTDTSDVPEYDQTGKVEITIR